MSAWAVPSPSTSGPPGCHLTGPSWAPFISGYCSGSADPHQEAVLTSVLAAGFKALLFLGVILGITSLVVGLIMLTTAQNPLAGFVPWKVTRDPATFFDCRLAGLGQVVAAAGLLAYMVYGWVWFMPHLSQGLDPYPTALWINPVLLLASLCTSGLIHMRVRYRDRRTGQITSGWDNLKKLFGL